MLVFRGRARLKDCEEKDVQGRKFQRPTSATDPPIAARGVHGPGPGKAQYPLNFHPGDRHARHRQPGHVLCTL